MKLSMIILFLIGATSVFGQKIQSNNYGTTGYVNADGKIQDASYRTVGYIKSDGKIQDN